MSCKFNQYADDSNTFVLNPDNCIISAVERKRFVRMWLEVTISLKSKGYNLNIPITPRMDE